MPHLAYRYAFTIACAALLGLAGCQSSMSQQGSMTSMNGRGGPMRMDRAAMDGMMSGWSAASREAAMFMMDKYGPPAEMTASMAVWHRTGPWKRTIVYREEVPHAFPMPHPDVMEQFIDYRVPPEMYDELAMYDGSVIAERTKGELSARCDKEGANFLAINLAHEIATGRRTVQDARRMYAEQIMAKKEGRPAPYTERLIFTPPPSGNDPDRPAM